MDGQVSMHISSSTVELHVIYMYLATCLQAVVYVSVNYTCLHLGGRWVIVWVLFLLTHSWQQKAVIYDILLGFQL